MKTKLVTGRKTDYQTVSPPCILSGSAMLSLKIVAHYVLYTYDECTYDSDNDDESGGVMIPLRNQYEEKPKISHLRFLLTSYAHILIFSAFLFSLYSSHVL